MSSLWNSFSGARGEDDWLLEDDDIERQRMVTRVPPRDHRRCWLGELEEKSNGESEISVVPPSAPSEELNPMHPAPDMAGTEIEMALFRAGSDLAPRPCEESLAGQAALIAPPSGETTMDTTDLFPPEPSIPPIVTAPVRSIQPPLRFADDVSERTGLRRRKEKREGTAGSHLTINNHAAQRPESSYYIETAPTSLWGTLYNLQLYDRNTLKERAREIRDTHDEITALPPRALSNYRDLANVNATDMLLNAQRHLRVWVPKAGKFGERADNTLDWYAWASLAMTVPFVYCAIAEPQLRLLGYVGIGIFGLVFLCIYLRPRYAPSPALYDPSLFHCSLVRFMTFGSRNELRAAEFHRASQALPEMVCTSEWHTKIVLNELRDVEISDLIGSRSFHFRCIIVHADLVDGLQKALAGMDFGRACGEMVNRVVEAQKSAPMHPQVVNNTMEYVRLLERARNPCPRGMVLA